MITVFAVFVCLSYAAFISHDPSDKVMRTAFGFIMLSAILSSVLSFSVDDTLLDANRDDMSDLANVTEEALEVSFLDGVRAAIADEFDIRASEILLIAEGFSADTLSAKVITVTLSGRAALADAGGIIDYLIENKLCGSAEIKLSL